ncbi:NUDIX hydrolase [Levilactobacillus angrenensis]|uniref:NUDIX hydrolase n=1 Tax=Levilactobacillus angrenensis TaxID=2486020 RepID=A0ABW1U9G3_9LACO|nr:NUDIX domain-containing protein [Levilactobacillus angrenensis]
MGYVLNLRQQVGHTPLIVVGAAAVVYRQAALLLVHRTDNHFWGLPAGSKELNESTLTTAQRELAEETGLTAQAAKLLTVVSGAGMQYQYPNGDQIDSVTVVYEVTATGEPNGDDDETSAAKFFPLDQLPTELTPLTREILKTLAVGQPK